MFGIFIIIFFEQMETFSESDREEDEGRRMVSGSLLGFQLEFLRDLCQTSAWGDKRLIKNLVKQGKYFKTYKSVFEFEFVTGMGVASGL